MTTIDSVAPADATIGAPARPRRGLMAIICGLMVLSGAIRVVGIGWDRPFFLHPDERGVTNPAWRLLTTGKMHPYAPGPRSASRYVYPPLFSEILALECLAWSPFSSWPGKKQIPEASVRMVGRATTLVAAVLTVALLTWLAWRLTGGLAAGALAGALLALSPLHAESSRYATTDVLAGLWVLLAAWASVRIVDEGRWRHYILGAVAVGVAAATKYPAGVACVAIAAAHLARPGALRSLRAQAKLAAAALTALAALVVVLPPGLVDWAEVADGVRHVAHVYGKGWTGFASPHAGLDGLVTLWSVGTGEAALLVGLLWLRGPTSRRRIVPIAVLVLGYLALLGAQILFMARNLVHFLPALLLLCSWGFGRALDLARRAGRPVAVAVGVVLIAPVAARAAVQVRALSGRDTRLLAHDWIAAHLKPGEKVALANGSGYPMVPLDDLPVRPRPTDRPDLDRLYGQGFRWLVYSDASDLRYLRSPERFPVESAAIRGWLDRLGGHARRVRHFPRRPLPGWDLPGSTANMYHQPDVTIYRLTRPAVGEGRAQEAAPRGRTR
jgi:dolichyl-phosphate-mannose-protein mannosyltransferase